MPAFREIWAFGGVVYLPSALFGIGQGAIMPVIVLTARDLGTSLSIAGLVAALLGVGQIVGDLPAGALAARLGERTAMQLAAVIVIAGQLACLFGHSVALLAAGVFVTGLGTAVWGLARHAYLAETMPYHLRGRALSTLGGMQRMGLFVGPLLGALVMKWLGINGAYLVCIVMVVVASLVLFFGPDVVATTSDAAKKSPLQTFAVMRRHAAVLRTVGVGGLLLVALRSSRHVIIPLWAIHLQLGPSQTSVIVAMGAAMDLLLFYPAGVAMDRWGRRLVVILSVLTLGAGYSAIPLASGPVSLALLAAVVGIGNGMSAGANMTLGADASPADGRATFLGAWRLLADLGSAAGPLVISAATAAAGTAAAATTVGGLAGVCAVVLWRWLPGSAPNEAERDQG